GMTTQSGIRTVDYAQAGAAALLPAQTRLGAVHLTVTDLATSVPFYENVVGLSEQWRGRTAADEPAVALGSEGNEPVVVLVESPTAAPPRRTSGLYHVALRYPRQELAHLVRRLSETRTPVQGASDHGTHEAIYLPDPDGNGLELEADRPRDQWPTSMLEEFAGGGPAPLDVEALVSISAAEATRERSAGVDMGHLHLHVGSVADAEAFYRDVVGFSLIAAMPTAIFMSAGGYHHHLGANVWNGVGAPPAQLGSVGMRRWSVVVPEADDLAALGERIQRAGGVASLVDEDGAIVIRDTSGNSVSIETEAQRSAAPVELQRPVPTGVSA
ncbi:MAG: VOC family protein, partial [Solirubrobacteraceae bacterium]|nr:VOC family protein [Solirubrobacteraceae bacterium]